MKVCEKCSSEIDTGDGVNLCQECEEAEDKGKRGRRRIRETKKAIEQALRDCGLTKVRGSLGGTYWE